VDTRLYLHEHPGVAFPVADLGAGVWTGSGSRRSWTPQDQARDATGMRPISRSWPRCPPAPNTPR